MQTEKRKRKNLSLREKLDIIESIDKGLPRRQIARNYGITEQAVSFVNRTKDKIQRISVRATTKEALERKSFKRPTNEYLELAVLNWIDQERAMKKEISGPLLTEAALDLNEKLGGNPNFKASCGWMENFKKRNGLKFYSKESERLAADVEAIKRFRDDFKRFIEENGYTTHNLYNADESWLNWRSLPHKTSHAKEENLATELKVVEDRVTALFCANASGSHRLPIVIIGKHKNPIQLKNDKDLPVIYKSQSSSWMERIVFEDWYENNFIPLVKEEQRRTGRQGKVLLLLDKAPSHPPEKVLNKIDNNFRVMYLPHNVTSLIQPMDQQVIITTKKFYRRSFTLQLLKSSCTAEEFLKAFNLKDCCCLIASAWANVPSSTLTRAWKKLIGCEESSSQLSENTTGERDGNFDLPDFVAIDVEENIGVEDNSNFDENFGVEDNVGVEENVDVEENAGVKENSSVEEYTASGTAQKVVEAVNVAYNWLEQQDECTPSYLATLNRLRDLAIRKSLIL